MEQIIKKAIEGGWICEYDEHVIEMNARKFSKSTAWKMRCAYFLCDPLFWQALGRACVWVKDENRITIGDNYIGKREEWVLYSLTFHEINLTEGWDKAISWLEDLLTQKP